MLIAAVNLSTLSTQIQPSATGDFLGRPWAVGGEREEGPAATCLASNRRTAKLRFGPVCPGKGKLIARCALLLWAKQSNGRGARPCCVGLCRTRANRHNAKIALRMVVPPKWHTRCSRQRRIALSKSRADFGIISSIDPQPEHLDRQLAQKSAWLSGLSVPGRKLLSGSTLLWSGSRPSRLPNTCSVCSVSSVRFNEMELADLWGALGP